MMKTSKQKLGLCLKRRHGNNVANLKGLLEGPTQHPNTLSHKLENIVNNPKIGIVGLRGGHNRIENIRSYELEAS